MKFDLEKKYMSQVFYVWIAAVAIFISYNAIFHFDMVVNKSIGLAGFLFKLFTPIIFGTIIAYLLFPIVKGIRSLLVNIFKINRASYLLSVILTYLCLIIAFMLLIYGLYALIGGQINGNVDFSVMIASIQRYLARYNDLLEFINRKITESGLSVDMKGYLNQTVGLVGKYITASVNNIFQLTMGFGNFILNAVMALFISFYMLKDFEFFKDIYFKGMSLIFRRERISSINGLLKEINSIISSFLRGQFLDGLIVGILCSIGLTAIGLDFAFIIGFTAGIANIIPYVGPIVGAVPAVIVGLLSDKPMNALWAVVIFLVVQQLDSAVISPKVVGDSLGLHPVFVIMAISIGGTLWGIPGMLLSVPVAAVIKLLIIKYARKKEATDQI